MRVRWWAFFSPVRKGKIAINFAFVRFTKLYEAKKAIKNLHETEIRGCNIKVSLAEFKRKEVRK